MIIIGNLDLMVDKSLYGTLITNNLEIYWKGFVFLPGIKDGKESLTIFFKENLDYEFNINKLYGSYVLIVKNMNTKEITCFSDNSGFAKIYYYKNIVSDSFLALTEHIGASDKDLDFQGIAEFIRMGFCFDRTYIKGLAILNKKYYIKMKNDKVVISPKNISAITEKGVDFYDFFKNLAKTLIDRKVVCDLTGGVDSRLIVSLLEYNSMQYNVSLSGRKDFIDHIKCSEISEILGKVPVYFDYLEGFDSCIADEIFKASDAQYPVLESYRNYLYDKCLKDTGHYIRLTGGNGELFKDEAWVKPHFLFSNEMLKLLWKRNSNHFKRTSQGLTDIMINEIEKVNAKVLKIKNMLEMKKATQSQDNYTYEFMMFYKASNFNIIANNVGLKQYSPLMEYDIARVGFNLKRKKRTAIRFHKEVITNTCSQIARVKTVNNYTCYNNKLFIVRDYGVNFKLFIEQVYRVLFKPLPKTDGATGDNLYFKAKENCERIETILKQHNIIDNKYELISANNILFDRLYTIGIFLKHLSSTSQKKRYIKHEKIY